MELWQQIGTVLGVVVIVAGFLVWHFRSIHALKDQIHALEKKCEGYATKDGLNDLQLEMKNLERTDALQQQTIDQLKELFPALLAAMKQTVEKQNP
ncbi:MAG: hypothetical protein QY325_08470 [Flavobacteriales bacterium]|nr:MAG: hypothetical protein QY325_08470 [Flavobacteriales bacterium]